MATFWRIPLLKPADPPIRPSRQADDAQVAVHGSARAGRAARRGGRSRPRFCRAVSFRADRGLGQDAGHGADAWVRSRAAAR